MEVGPGEGAPVEHEDHDVYEALHVVSARLVIAATTVEAGKNEVTAKLLDVFFLDVLTVCVEVAAAEPEIDQVDLLRILCADEYVVELQVVMHISHVMHRLQLV